MPRRILTTDRFAVLASAVAGGVTLATSIALQHQTTLLPADVALRTGRLIVVLGVVLFLWAAWRLGGSVMGGVGPRGGSLIVDGPFRLVRHPAYLGMTIAMAGVCLATRSVAGVVVLGLLFIPAEVHRARREERALLERFGHGWREYAARTPFFIPGLR